MSSPPKMMRLKILRVLLLDDRKQNRNYTNIPQESSSSVVVKSVVRKHKCEEESKKSKDWDKVEKLDSLGGPLDVQVFGADSNKEEKPAYSDIDGKNSAKMVD